MVLQNEWNRQVIDLFRAFGVLAVFLFHVLFILGGLMLAQDRERFVETYPEVLAFLWQPLGVPLIFLVSAFLLSHDMFREHARTGTVSYRDHFLRRLSRLIPLYYAALLLYAAPKGFPLDWLLESALFVSVKLHGNTIVPVGWSAEAMVHVFLVLPFFVLFLARRRSPLPWMIGLFVAAVAARLVYMATSSEDWDTVYFRVLAREDVSVHALNLYRDAWFNAAPFVAGIVLAWAVTAEDQRLSRWLAISRNWWLVMASGLFLTISTYNVPLHHADSWSYRVGGDLFWMLFIALQAPAFSIGTGLLLLALFYSRSARQGRSLPRFISRPMSLISRNMFGLYLFHYLMIVVATVVVFRSVDRERLADLTIWHMIAIALVAFAGSMLLAMLATRWVERPVQSWIRRRFDVERPAERMP